THNLAIFEYCSRALCRYCRDLGIDARPEHWGTHSWLKRLERASQEIAQVVPVGESFILVDEEQWDAGDSLSGRKRIPFLERDGQYWGNPSGDEEAIREIERLRRIGASAIAFAWPAFWWLDHYEGMHRYLQSQCPCLLRNDRLVIFDLRA